MNWDNLKTHGLNASQAFESLCTHLFERWAWRERSNEVVRVQVINGAGGDAGVEAIATLNTGMVIGVQAKYFRQPINRDELGQVSESIKAAMKARGTVLEKYIVCFPRNFGSLSGQKKNVEWVRWDKWKKEKEIEYPGLSIVLWDDSKIEAELFRPGAEGIGSFYFEYGNLRFDRFKDKFKEATNTWLRLRYVPDLHKEGEIKDLVSLIMLTEPARIEMHSFLKARQNLLGRAIQSMSSVPKETLDDEANKSWNRVIGLLEYGLKVTEVLFGYLDNQVGIVASVSDTIDWGENDSDVADIILCLQSTKYSNLRQILPLRVQNALHDVHGFVFETFRIWLRALQGTSLFIAGEPGTGKTHGVADMTKSLLSENIPTILLRAKGTSPKQSWEETIRQYLGLSSVWSEPQILEGIDALIHQCNVVRTIRAKESGTEEKPFDAKLLIIVDGIDESTEYRGWIKLIEKVDHIIRQNPKISFVFTSRKPILVDQRLLTNAMFHEVGSSGDRMVYDLFDDYFRKYDIDDSQYPLIRLAIRTPFDLSLFCELYKGRKNNLDSCATTLLGLLEEKFNRLDLDLRDKFGLPSLHINLTKGLLSELVDYFLQPNSNFSGIDEGNLAKIVFRVFGIGDQNLARALNIVEEFMQNGILTLVDRTSTSPSPSSNFLEANPSVYAFAIQNILDYVLALKGVKETLENPAQYPRLFQQLFLYKMLGWQHEEYAALILFESGDGLVGEDPLWVDGVKLSYSLPLRYRVLSLAPFHLLYPKRESLVREVKGHSPILGLPLNTPIRGILHELILRIWHIPGHPLGSDWIHNVLASCNSSYERDLIWSPKTESASLNGLPRDIAYATLDLKPGMSHLLLPQVLAWRLGMLNFQYKSVLKRCLLTWALSTPGEFRKLLDRVFVQSNDPQMREELMLVAMSFACETSDMTELMSISSWMLDNLFNLDGLRRHSSTVIRHSARLCVERAIHMKRLLHRTDHNPQTVVDIAH